MWTASVKRGKDGATDVASIHVWHCQPQQALELTSAALGAAGGTVADTELSGLQRAGVSRRVFVRKGVTTTVEWQRDQFDPSPSSVVETGSFAATVRGTSPGDRDASASSGTPVVSAWPACARGKWHEAEQMVTIPSGPAVGTALRCGEHQTALDGFRIDRDLTSCDAFNACVHAGACPAQHESCRHEAAVVGHGAAAAYCQWRHAELPSFAQWQRAIRGPEARLYPTGGAWLRDLGCAQPTISESDAVSGALRCRNTNAAGIVHYVLDPNEIEWTRDDDCIDPKQPQERLPVGVNVYVESLDREFLRPSSADYGEFRCVKP
jgi:hypothetical protein